MIRRRAGPGGWCGRGGGGCGLAASGGRGHARCDRNRIKIGHTNPYSGPASAYSSLGKLEQAYFNKMVNEQGGVAGHKINFISLDDGYSPPKTVEDIRQLGGGRQGRLHLQHAGHADQQRDRALHEPAQGADAFRRHRCRQVGQLPTVSVDHRLAAELPHGSADLHEVHAAAEAGRQDGDPLSERRLRQGLSGRREGRAGQPTIPRW